MSKLPIVTRMRKALPRIAEQKTTLSGMTAEEQIDAALNQFQVDVCYRKRLLSNLPSRGKMMVLANDPVPNLSYLALLHWVLQIRSDVRVLMPSSQHITPELERWVISTSDHTLSSMASAAALSHLAAGGVLIVFPVHLGRVIGVPKLKRERWPEEFLDLARRSQAPLLHVHVGSVQNPWLNSFRYLTKGLKPLQQTAQRLIPSAFKLELSVGDVIDVPAYSELNLRDKLIAKLLCKQLYRVAVGKVSYFKTMEPIASPEDPYDLKEKLDQSLQLGHTRDNKLIFVCQLTQDEPLLREIGRLREESFRVVGEGSGRARDIDQFDAHYEHIVLWDDNNQEVVGAYRLRPTCESGANGLYTSTLVHYAPESEPILERGVELGRSFVQPKYWGSRSLDYLWVGIAAYVRKNPQARYLLGAVSISDAFCTPAKDLLVAYYQKYYFARNPIVSCQRPYDLTPQAQEKANTLFDGLDVRDAFVALKEQLGLLGHSVPTLYKQYTELCEPGGALFHGFNVDPDFQNCIDGLVVVDLHQLKTLKRKRYGLLEHDFMAGPTLSAARNRS